MSNNPYSTLGLDKTASEAEIKKAYRKSARAYHPDLNPDDKAAEAKFKAASVAYDLLKDPETRARFDRGEIDASGAELRPKQRYSRGYGEQPDQGFGGFGDMSGIFAEAMRQRAGQGQSYNARGADARFALNVTFIEAVKGGKKRITLPSGDNLELTIPEGTADGQTIRLRGKGDAGMGRGARGDAYVTINVLSHRVFSREDDDIVIILPITFDEAVLGGKVATPTIDGSVNLTIPKGASSGQILRLRGRGVQRAGGKAGDQRVELRIVAPPEIDADLQEFMTQWRETHAYDPRKGMTS